MKICNRDMFVAFSLSSMPCLCLAFALSCLCLSLSWLCLCPCLCLVFSSLLLSCPYLVLSCLLFVSSWGSFRVIFGRLGGVLGSFLVVLRVVLVLLGGVLGCVLGVLEALEAVLGRVDAPKGSAQKSVPLLDRFSDPSWAPRGSQDGAQNDQKSITKLS